MRRAIICIVTLVICAYFVLPSYAFFNSEVRKAKKFMAAQMYQQAIGLLTKRINEKPTDEDAHFLLAECLLYTGSYRQASKRFDSAVSLKPELKNQAAQTCLKVVETIKNVPASNQILMVAEQYALNPETKKSIGQKELQLSRQCSGVLQKSLMQRAARYLGDAEVYGFEIRKIDSEHVKIIFHTDRPVKVINLKKGETYKIIEVSNSKLILEYFPSANQNAPFMLNSTFTANKDCSLWAIGVSGGHLILEHKKH